MPSKPACIIYAVLLCITKFISAQEEAVDATTATDEETLTFEIDMPDSATSFEGKIEQALANRSFEEPDYSAVIHPDDTISIDFPDEEVRTIIRNIAELHDFNVVIPAELHARTSIKLRNANWRQIFEVLLDPLGYTYRQDRAIIYIEPKTSNFVKGISDNMAFILAGALLLSIALNIFLLVRRWEKD